MTAGALILAAGFSRRFGTDKRQFQLASGRPMLMQTLERYGDVFDSVAVVLRTDDHPLMRQIREAYTDHPPYIIATTVAAEGMAHSLADGVRALRTWDYLFVGLGDMPFVRVDTLRALSDRMRALRANGAPAIIQPVLDGVPGHPVGFTCDFFAEISALTGERGARAVLERHRSVVDRVPVDDPGVLRDIDTPPP
jgi:molybdenum cofactor cytidylyltransferase